MAKWQSGKVCHFATTKIMLTFVMHWSPWRPISPQYLTFINHKTIPMKQSKNHHRCAVGTVITEARQLCGYTVTDFCREAGISVKSYYRLMQKKDWTNNPRSGVPSATAHPPRRRLHGTEPCLYTCHRERLDPVSSVDNRLTIGLYRFRRCYDQRKILPAISEKP